MDPLIGRDTELAQLRQAIGPGRLVAVTGPPGVGKSALVRAALGGRERVVWVDLEGARTTPDLWAALGRALGLSLTDPGRARDRLARALRELAVVVLDGAELLDEPAWAALEELRRDRPELAWVVAAVLARARPSAELQLSPLGADAARELLLARATARSLGRALDPADPAWGTIAERLDGLPLALELAAGRLALMSPGDLLQRLEVAVVRGADRRTSVEGALRSCWDLLGEADQRELVGLSLFRGFTVELAEGLLGADALATLERLRARSAVALRDGRLGVLEGLRAIALERADDEVRARFVRFWASHARELRRRSDTGRQVEATRALRDEQANLKAALGLAVRLGATADAVPIARQLVLSLRLHGPLWWLDELPDPLPLAAAADAESGADLLALWGSAVMHLGRTRVARDLLGQSLVLSAPVVPHSEARSTAWSELGWLEFVESNLDAAREALTMALRAAPDRPRAALALNRLSSVSHVAGDHATAVRHLEEALARLAPEESPRLHAALRVNLGLYRAEEGRRVEAEDLLRRGAEDLVELDLLARATALQALGLVGLAFGTSTEPSPLAEAHRLLDRHGGDIALGNVAVARALERWCAGDRGGARERLIEATERLQEIDAVGVVEVRAWRAALEADSGRPETLGLELAAARADGAHPNLLDVLAAFGGGEPPPPAPIEPLHLRIARRLLQRGPPALRCDRAGRWFERPGDRVDLARRGALQRILGALVEARVSRPGHGLSVQDLFEAGWPGDRALPDAASARVYTAVRELRSLGIGDVLRREAQGYLLDPGARIDVQA